MRTNLHARHEVLPEWVASPAASAHSVAGHHCRVCEREKVGRLTVQYSYNGYFQVNHSIRIFHSNFWLFGKLVEGIDELVGDLGQVERAL